MKTDTIIVRYAELGLKGKNRNEFEKRLVRNIKACLNTHTVPYEDVRRIRGRIFITSDASCKELADVFGIRSFSPSKKCPADRHEIISAAETFLDGITQDSTFRVSTHRGDKTTAFSSSDIDISLGSHIAAKTGAKVSLKSYDHEIGVEIYEGQAYLFCERIAGPGGLPLGSAGKVCILFESRKSVATSWLMMKRGCMLSILAAREFPEIQKIQAISYGCGIETVIGPYERSRELGCSAFVSEQDIDNISPYPVEAAILRPLTGYSKEEQEQFVQKIINSNE